MIPNLHWKGEENVDDGELWETHNSENGEIAVSLVHQVLAE